MLINTIIWPFVGADSSSPSPVYRPSMALHTISFNFSLPFIAREAEAAFAILLALKTIAT